MTDVLGVLEAFDDASLTIRPETGERVTIERGLVVTGKPVPPRSSTRLRISSEQLERICELGWRAPQERALGDWTLRAGAGFTGRANSARVGGDPGLETDDAIASVVAFYAEQDLPPLAQVIVGTRWQQAFEARDWRPARPGGQDALVQVASTAQALRLKRARSEASGSGSTGDPAEVTLEPRVNDDWMALYGRAAGVDLDVVRSVMESGDAVVFARVGDPVVAIGRAVVTGDWMGLQGVEVAPDHRGQGLATRVVDTLLDWGASQGALSAYLQTVADNAAAVRLYDRYGFVTHHAYRYLGPAWSLGG